MRGNGRGFGMEGGVGEGGSSRTGPIAARNNAASSSGALSTGVLLGASSRGLRMVQA
jgi:hypothetical protein